MSRVLVIVAHNDDEVLWAGGYLAANPMTDVLCCSVPKAKPERAVYFFDACHALGVYGFIAGGLAGNGLVDVTPAMRIACQYDEIITHNHVGEYGHPAHIQVHEAMKKLCMPMRVFGFGLELGPPMPEPLYQRKLEALACYRNPKILENQSRNFNLRRETFL